MLLFFALDSCWKVDEGNLPARDCQNYFLLDLRRQTKPPDLTTWGTEKNKKLHHTGYIPTEYSDYIPEMDDSGIKYEKYMQGQPAAMKFQEKVLPEGSYQKYIPLSQNGKASVQENFAPEAVLAAAKSEKRDDSKGKGSAKAKDKDESTAENAGNSEMDFQRYLHQPSPGPVVDTKYGKYVPSKYSDYIPELDDSGIKYEKYMPDKGTEMHRAGSSSRGNVVAEDCFFQRKCDGVDLKHRYNFDDSYLCYLVIGAGRRTVVIVKVLVIVVVVVAVVVVVVVVAAAINLGVAPV